MDKETRYDQLVRHLKNNWIIAILLITFAALIGLEKLFSATSSLHSIYEKHFPKAINTNEQHQSNQTLLPKNTPEKQPNRSKDDAESKLTKNIEPTNTEEKPDSKTKSTYVDQKPSLQSVEFKDGFLRGTVSIEALIVNPENSPLILKSIAITGTKRGPKECKSSSTPELWNVINLDWKGVAIGYIRDAPNKFVIYESGKVQIRTKRANCHDNTYGLQINIPMHNYIEPNHQKNLVIQLKEIVDTGELGELVPKNLKDWENLTLSIDSTKAVHPIKLQLTK